MPTISHHRFRLCGLLLIVVAFALAPLQAGAETALVDPNAPNLTPEETIALKFAPIAYLKTQREPCDSAGEPYAPAAVDVVLNDPEVVLRDTSTAKTSSGDPVLATGPDAATVGQAPKTAYLDLPGDPLHAGCSYEQFFKARSAGQPPMVYAHIATERGVDGFALQYWFYYVYNRFNNLHESDWEMIQLNFEDLTVEQALAEDATPDTVAYAQHGGGERADWDSSKLRKEGTHPLVYPAAGSHAAYYGDYIYIGWGERGSGLGCDDSSGPSTAVPLAISMLPTVGTPTDAPWLRFLGRWGERKPWEFNGPTGPATKTQWTQPFSWTDDLRASSLPLISSSTIGPDPTRIFCEAVALGSDYIVFRGGNISLADILLVIFALIPIVLIALSFRVLGHALWLYIRHVGIFLPLGAIPFAVAIIEYVLQPVLQRLPIIEDVLDFIDVPLNQGAFVFGGSALQQAISVVYTLPAIVYAVRQIQRGRTPTFKEANRFALGILPTTARAAAINALIIVLLLLSIVGIPWAIMRFVRWLLTMQAIVLDGASWRNARLVSAKLVTGRWWRTGLLTLVLTGLNSLAGPMIGLVVMIFVTPSALVAQITSSLLYVLLFPMVGIATSLWYERLKRERGRQEPAPSPAMPAGLAPAK